MRSLRDGCDSVRHLPIKSRKPWLKALGASTLTGSSRTVAGLEWEIRNEGVPSNAAVFSTHGANTINPFFFCRVECQQRPLYDDCAGYRANFKGFIAITAAGQLIVLGP